MRGESVVRVRQLMAVVGLGAVLSLPGCGEGGDAARASGGVEPSAANLEAPAAIPSRTPQGPRDTVSWDPSGPLTGTWRGTWSFYGRTVEGEAHAVLRHYNESFNGRIELTPDVGAVCGKTSGTIVWGLNFDDYVTFGFYDIYAYGFTFHGTLRGDELAGDILAVTDCGAESGTFRLTR